MIESENACACRRLAPLLKAAAQQALAALAAFEEAAEVLRKISREHPPTLRSIPLDPLSMALWRTYLRNIVDPTVTA